MAKKQAQPAKVAPKFEKKASKPIAKEPIIAKPKKVEAKKEVKEEVKAMNNKLSEGQWLSSTLYFRINKIIKDDVEVSD